MDQATAVSPGDHAQDQPHVPPSRTNGVLRGVGIVITGLVAGAVGVAALQGSTGATTTPAAATTVPGARFGPPPGGTAVTIVSGSLTTARSSSITVLAADGTSRTVAVNATTEVIRNGAQAVLSDLASGDQVVVSVAPSGTSPVASRVVAAGAATSRT
jgi:hypothetical protein